MFNPQRARLIAAAEKISATPAPPATALAPPIDTTNASTSSTHQAVSSSQSSTLTDYSRIEKTVLTSRINTTNQLETVVLDIINQGALEVLKFKDYFIQQMAKNTDKKPKSYVEQYIDKSDVQPPAKDGNFVVVQNKVVLKIPDDEINQMSFLKGYEANGNPIGVKELACCIDGVYFLRDNQVQVCGDLHGSLLSVYAFLTQTGCIKNNNSDTVTQEPNQTYVFLGDYGDRGTESLEVMLTLLVEKVRNPQKFVLLRGNHETTDYVNAEYEKASHCVLAPENILTIKAIPDENSSFDELAADCTFWLIYCTANASWYVLSINPKDMETFFFTQVTKSTRQKTEIEETIEELLQGKTATDIQNLCKANGKNKQKIAENRELLEKLEIAITTFSRFGHKSFLLKNQLVELFNKSIQNSLQKTNLLRYLGYQNDNVNVSEACERYCAKFMSIFDEFPLFAITQDGALIIHGGPPNFLKSPDERQPTTASTAIIPSISTPASPTSTRTSPTNSNIPQFCHFKQKDANNNETQGKDCYILNAEYLRKNPKKDLMMTQNTVKRSQFLDPQHHFHMECLVDPFTGNLYLNPIISTLWNDPHQEYDDKRQPIDTTCQHNSGRSRCLNFGRSYLEAQKSAQVYVTLTGHRYVHLPRGQDTDFSTQDVNFPLFAFPSSEQNKTNPFVTVFSAGGPSIPNTRSGKNTVKAIKVNGATTYTERECPVPFYVTLPANRSSLKDGFKLSGNEKNLEIHPLSFSYTLEEIKKAIANNAMQETLGNYHAIIDTLKNVVTIIIKNYYETFATVHETSWEFLQKLQPKTHSYIYSEIGSDGQLTFAINPYILYSEKSCQNEAERLKQLSNPTLAVYRALIDIISHLKIIVFHLHQDQNPGYTCPPEGRELMRDLQLLLDNNGNSSVFFPLQQLIANETGQINQATSTSTSTTSKSDSTDPWFINVLTKISEIYDKITSCSNRQMAASVGISSSTTSLPMKMAIPRSLSSAAFPAVQNNTSIANTAAQAQAHSSTHSSRLFPPPPPKPKDPPLRPPEPELPSASSSNANAQRQ